MTSLARLSEGLRAEVDSKIQEPPPMKKNNLKNASAQAEPPINEHPFLAHVRERLRLMAEQILAEEVSALYFTFFARLRIHP